MRTKILYITIALLMTSCESEMINRFDIKDSLSTKIELSPVSSEIIGSEIVITSSLRGGNGQYIHYVGHCWDYYENYSYSLPMIQDNSNTIVYSSIFSGKSDLNSDGVVDVMDIPKDGSQISRNFTSVIPYYADSVCVVGSFAVFNESIIYYGYWETIE
ncbi:MAG: hypothetical protein PF450_09185 [Bacteroidales bacterium]|nr:hypothetical protein [Bacteroidales bacterium]